MWKVKTKNLRILILLLIAMFSGLIIYYNNIYATKMLFIYRNTPLRYFVKYKWDISKDTLSEVNAYMSYKKNEYKLIITGSGDMVDFSAENNRCAWTEFQDMTLGWLYNLGTVEIGEGVTNIGNAAFASQSELRTVMIPSSLSVIGESAFWNCRSLEEVRFGGTREQWKGIVLGDKWNWGTNVQYVVCTDGKIYLQKDES